jgi:hypothetical protein
VENSCIENIAIGNGRTIAQEAGTWIGQSMIMMVFLVVGLLTTCFFLSLCQQGKKK